MVPLLSFRLPTLQVFGESAGRHSCILLAARVTFDSLEDDSSSRQSLLLNIVYNRRLIVLWSDRGYHLISLLQARTMKAVSCCGLAPTIVPEMFESLKSCGFEEENPTTCRRQPIHETSVTVEKSAVKLVKLVKLVNVTQLKKKRGLKLFEKIFF
jgi:hypothetical protein